jgi:hypothetical protein
MIAAISIPIFPLHIDQAIRQIGVVPKVEEQKPVARTERGWTPTKPGEEPPF